MSDYLSCPACHGKGLIPLEEAERITAHASQESRDQAQARWEQRAEMVRQDNELRAWYQTTTPEQRRADAERRLADLERRAGLGSAA